MSVSREVTIWCDECMQWEQRSEAKVSTIRKELKAPGWTRVRQDGRLKDLCPGCARNGSNGSEEGS